MLTDIKIAGKYTVFKSTWIGNKIKDLFLLWSLKILNEPQHSLSCHHQNLQQGPSSVKNTGIKTKLWISPNATTRKMILKNVLKM